MSKGDKPEWRPPTTEESILQYLTNADYSVSLGQFDSAERAYKEALSAAKKLFLDHKLDPFKYMLALTRAIIGYTMMNSWSDATGLMRELMELTDAAGSSGVRVPAQVKGILQKNLQLVGKMAEQRNQKDLVQLASTLSGRVSSLG